MPRRFRVALRFLLRRNVALRLRRLYDLLLVGAVLIIMVLAHKQARSLGDNICDDQPQPPAVVDGPELCLENPPTLHGRVEMKPDAVSHEELESLHSELNPGGHWAPSHCRPRNRVAIVVPYRDRDVHLRLFLQHMHPFLQKQLLEYRIYVVEQSLGTEFNRGMLKNIGFVEANRMGQYDCTIFHDVDLRPENDHNWYGCSQPSLIKHMCISLDYYNYTPLANGAVFGGVVSFRPEQFRKANGFSNLYFGWGGEDDDLFYRVRNAGYKVQWITKLKGMYKGSSHGKENKGKDNAKLWNGRYARMGVDGLNSLQYKVRFRVQRQTFTWILVDVLDDKYRKEAADFIAHPNRTLTKGR